MSDSATVLSPTAADPIDVHLGAKLLQVRVLRRLTREELGKELGVSPQQIAKYESGENRIASATLCRAARFLRIKIAWFFEGLDGEDGEAPRALDAEQIQLLDQFDRISDNGMRRIFIHFARGLADRLLAIAREHEADGAAASGAPLRGVEVLMK